MAKKVILGSDFGRDAFKAKVNENFTELYDNSVYQQGQIEDKLSTSHNTDANAHDDIRESINDLDADKMPISTMSLGALGEFKQINSDIGGGLSLPSGGSWEFIGMWVDNATAVTYSFGGANAGVAPGGTQILAGQTGKVAIAFVRKVA